MNRISGWFEGLRRPRIGATPYLFSLPSFLALGLILASVVFGFYLSLTSYGFVNPRLQFVGIDNYVDALNSKPFLTALQTSLVIGISATAVEVIGGLAVALLLSQPLRFIAGFRVIASLPLMIPAVIAGVMWRVMMSQGTGILNHVLSWFGLGGPAWLNDPTWAPVSIVLIDFWINLPFAALVLLAGIQSLPGEPIEAATADGASSLQRLRYIILPLLRPFIFLVIAFRLMDVLQLFDIVYATTDGGPGNATLTLPIYIYQTGFRSGLLGYATAMGFLLYLLIFIATRSALRLRRAEG